MRDVTRATLAWIGLAAVLVTLAIGVDNATARFWLTLAAAAEVAVIHQDRWLRGYWQGRFDAGAVRRRTDDAPDLTGPKMRWENAARR